MNCYAEHLKLSNKYHQVTHRAKLTENHSLGHESSKVKKNWLSLDMKIKT